MILVDACIWSEAFRKVQSTRPDVVETLGALIQKAQVQIIGPVRQEVLSGIRDINQYQKLRDILRVFTDIHLESSDFELAAEYSNTCCRKGVQGSDVDLLICAVAARHGFLIFTLDADFTHYAKILPVQLYSWRH